MFTDLSLLGDIKSKAVFEYFRFQEGLRVLPHKLTSLPSDWTWFLEQAPQHDLTHHSHQTSVYFSVYPCNDHLIPHPISDVIPSHCLYCFANWRISWFLCLDSWKACHAPVHPHKKPSHRSDVMTQQQRPGLRHTGPLWPNMESECGQDDITLNGAYRLLS